MKTIQGPAIFLAQFAGDQPPYNTLEGMAGWAAKHGYAGIQIPSWDRRLFDLERAAESQAYCDEVKGIAAQAGLAVTELLLDRGADLSIRVKLPGNIKEPDEIVDCTPLGYAIRFPGDDPTHSGRLQSPKTIALLRERGGVA